MDWSGSSKKASYETRCKEISSSRKELYSSRKELQSSRKELPEYYLIECFSSGIIYLVLELFLICT